MSVTTTTSLVTTGGRRPHSTHLDSSHLFSSGELVRLQLASYKREFARLERRQRARGSFGRADERKWRLVSAAAGCRRRRRRTYAQLDRQFVDAHRIVANR